MPGASGAAYDRHLVAATGGPRRDRWMSGGHMFAAHSAGGKECAAQLDRDDLSQGVGPVRAWWAARNRVSSRPERFYGRSAPRVVNEIGGEIRRLELERSARDLARERPRDQDVALDMRRVDLE